MTNPLDIRFGLLVIAFFVWIYRAGRALRTLRLAPAIRPVRQKAGKKVSVIIPARNEENNIAACVDGFLNQSYANLEIIVANDNSSDATEEILKSYGDKIRYLNVPPTPEGWTGKNFAMHNAVQHASGDWFLFTDADTRHAPESVASSLSYARSNKVRLLTLLPKCLTDSFWEHLLQPLAMGYLGLWFPIEDINNDKKSVCFANGQYILMDRRLYEKVKGWLAVKNEILEDFAMMECVKSRGYKAECGLGMDIFGTRMYESLAQIWRGWRKIYLYAFKRNSVALLGRFLSMVFFSVIPFVSFLMLFPMALNHPDAHGFVLGALTALLVLIIATAWKTYGIMKANRLYVLLHPVGGFFIAMILLDACWMAISGKEPAWR